MSGGTLYTSAKCPGGQILGGTLCTTTPSSQSSPSPSLRTSEAVRPSATCTLDAATHSGHTNKKPCAVHGCPELVAPTMWKHHMTLHAQGLFPGEVPVSGLKEHNLYLCSVVAESHRSSYQRKCNHTVHATAEPLVDMPPIPGSNYTSLTSVLPTFEDVCQLPCYTLRHVPAKARSTFARILSAALRNALHEYTEESWLKLFMLPKCILHSHQCRGRHHKLTPIEYLCDLWSKGRYGLLWQRAGGQSTSNTRYTQGNDNDKKVHTSIALAREGLFGKACQVLTSSGLAPNTNDTWELLQSKHPKGPLPVPPSGVTTPLLTIVPNDFNIMAILRSFPKTASCGPSGLCIQHLLDAAEVPLQFPMCSSLKDLVNLLASGNVPVLVSKYLAGGSLTALMKDKADLSLDIRPIAVGVALRRLLRKCLCAVERSMASDFFAPHQFGVASPSAAEKVIHGLRSCI